MKKLYSFKKTCLHFLIFFIVIALHAPIYHQHVDDNHQREPLKHSDYIAPHHPNDYSVNSHRTGFSQDVLPEESHHAHYHSHFDRDLLQTSLLDTKKVKAISVYTFMTFNNLSTHSLALKKHSYDYYKPKYYNNISAKTSSGLSPPIYST